MKHEYLEIYVKLHVLKMIRIQLRVLRHLCSRVYTKLYLKHKNLEILLEHMQI